MRTPGSAGEEFGCSPHSLRLQPKATTITQQASLFLGRSGHQHPRFHSLWAGRSAQIKANISRTRAQRTNALFRLAAFTGHSTGRIAKSKSINVASAPRLLRHYLSVDHRDATYGGERPDIPEADRDFGAATAAFGVCHRPPIPSLTLGVTTGSTVAVHGFPHHPD